MSKNLLNIKPEDDISANTSVESRRKPFISVINTLIFLLYLFNYC